MGIGRGESARRAKRGWWSKAGGGNYIHTHKRKPVLLTMGEQLGFLCDLFGAYFGPCFIPGSWTRRACRNGGRWGGAGSVVVPKGCALHDVEKNHTQGRATVTQRSDT